MPLIKFLIIIIICCCSDNLQANFLDDIGDAVRKGTDLLCKLGHDDIHENWGGDPERYNGNILDTGKPQPKPRNQILENHANCPPYNKNSGRNGCVLQFPYPYLNLFAFNTDYVPGWYHFPAYIRYCAQTTPSSDYFSPKILVKGQICNQVGCGHIEQSLGIGDCLVRPTPWLLPTLRICARVAIPNSSLRPKEGATREEAQRFWCANKDLSKDKFCQPDNKDDPGYTRCYHLNHEGEQVIDKIYTNKKIPDCQIRVIVPKLCAYVDPSLAAGSFEADLFDLNPTRQPLHKGGMFPIGAMIISFIESGLSLDQALRMLYERLLETIDLGFVKDIVHFIGQIIQKVGTTFIGMLKDIFELNKVVNDSIGCVELPLGPYPPPFCPRISKASFSPSVEMICTTEMLDQISKGNINKAANKCIVSNVVNNVIHNAVRISYNHALPLCSPDKQGALDYTSEKCVMLRGALPTSIARNQYKDIIPACSSSNSNTPCIAYQGCSGSNSLSCQRGFRILYTAQLKGLESDNMSELKPNNFDYCLMDRYTSTCPSNKSDAGIDCCQNSMMTQEIWGVDTGDYDDLVLNFPQEETVDTKLPLIASVLLDGKSFLAMITRTAQPICAKYLANNNDLNACKDSHDVLYTQNPQEICVYQGQELIGCVARPNPPIPVSIRCGNGINCADNNHFIPSIGVKLEVVSQGIAYSTQGGLAVANIHNNSNGNINLAGFNYSAFATDEKLTVKQKNPGTILGNYKDKTKGDNNVKNLSNNDIYFDQLEYLLNKYVAGGKYVCITDFPIQECPGDKHVCILAKKLNQTNGSLQYKLVSEENNDRICPKPTLNCDVAQDNYPECLKLNNNDYFDIDINDPNQCNARSNQNILTTIDNPSKQVAYSKSNGEIDVSKIANCTKQQKGCKTIKYSSYFDKVINIQQCADNHICMQYIEACPQVNKDNKNLNFTGNALLLSKKAVGIMRLPSADICYRKVEKDCKNISDTSICEKEVKITDQGNIILVKYCQDQKVDSNNKNMNNLGFLCQTNQIQDCNALRDQGSKLTFTKQAHDKNPIEGIDYERIEGLKLIDEFIEKKPYIIDPDNPDTKGICGLAIGKCRIKCSKDEIGCDPNNNIENDDIICPVLKSKMQMADGNEYNLRNCSEYFCIEKIYPKQNIEIPTPKILNIDAFGIRSKNSFELGLCEPIPEAPRCSAQDYENAHWPDAKSSEEKVRGWCISEKYTPKSSDSLLRYCYFNPQQNADIHFSYGKSVSPVYEEDRERLGCKKISCDSETGNGGIYWPSVEVDDYSQARCNSPNDILVGSPTSRQCLLDSSRKGKAILQGGSNAYCKSLMCDAKTENGIYWPSVKVGEYSYGQCSNAADKFTGSNKRSCKRIGDNAQFDQNDAKCVTSDGEIKMSFGKGKLYCNGFKDDVLELDYVPFKILSDGEKLSIYIYGGAARGHNEFIQKYALNNRYISNHYDSKMDTLTTNVKCMFDLHITLAVINSNNLNLHFTCEPSNICSIIFNNKEFSSNSDIPNSLFKITPPDSLGQPYFNPNSGYNNSIIFKGNNMSGMDIKYKLEYKSKK